MGKAVCRICGYEGHWLGDHMVDEHELSLGAYLKAYPGAATASERLVALWEDRSKDAERAHPAATESLKITFCGIPVPVNPDVPMDACFPLPTAFRVPAHGDLKEDIWHAVVAMVRGRSLYIHGPPGCGKDALFHGWSYMTRAPADIYNIDPDADLRPWFFSHEITQEGTVWQEGKLLQQLRDGYVSPTSGRRIPYLILITDFDRATKAQVETLRLVLDSIQGRIKGPNGITYRVLPGTQIVVTANTAGGGDPRGRCISANIIDASIMDRFGDMGARAFEFHPMAWEDEGLIVREKFPLLVERCNDVFEQVGKATTALRKAVADERLYAEFTHRSLCAWLGHTEDIIRVTGAVPQNILKEALRAVVDKFGDTHTRQEAMGIIDPFIQGGVVEVGDTSHIQKEKLSELMDAL